MKKIIQNTRVFFDFFNTYLLGFQVVTNKKKNSLQVYITLLNIAWVLQEVYYAVNWRTEPGTLKEKKRFLLTLKTQFFTQKSKFLPKERIYYNCWKCCFQAKSLLNLHKKVNLNCFFQMCSEYAYDIGNSFLWSIFIF